MFPDEPMFRSDLVISPQETAAGPSYVIKDPASGRCFSLRETEYFIARQLDGSTPLDVISQRIGEKAGGEVEAETICRFVEKLRAIGLLERQTEAQSVASSAKKSRGSPLYLRLKAFDPDRLLDRMVGRLEFFFSPYFLVLSAVAIVG